MISCYFDFCHGNIQINIWIGEWHRVYTWIYESYVKMELAINEQHAHITTGPTALNNKTMHRDWLNCIKLPKYVHRTSLNSFMWNISCVCVCVWVFSFWIDFFFVFFFSIQSFPFPTHNDRSSLWWYAFVVKSFNVFNSDWVYTLDIVLAPTTCSVYNSNVKDAHYITNNIPFHLFSYFVLLFQQWNKQKTYK